MAQLKLATGGSTAISPGEQEARVALAALYRLCDHFGWGTLIYNHIAARVPGEPCFLVKPHDMMFHEVKASSLLKLRLDGRIMDESAGVSPASFTIHTACMNARPELNYTIHVHTNAGVAMASRRKPLLPFYQRSMIFHNRLSYHDYEGIARDISEAERLARDLGPRNKAVMLRNHGLLTCGRTPAEALSLMRYLVESCEIQLMMEAAGDDIVCPPDEVCEHTARQWDELFVKLDEADWKAYLRTADALDPSYRH